MVDVLYNLKQNQIGHVRSEVVTVTETTSVNIAAKSNVTLVINATAQAVITLVGTPPVGAYLRVIALNITTNATVVLPSGVTWDGSNNTATFDADGEKIGACLITSTRWFVDNNPNSVAFS